LYSDYEYDGETIEFILETYEKVLCNRTRTMSKPTYYLHDILNEIDRYYAMDYEKAIRFLESEIRVSEQRRNTTSPMYDGENVGTEISERLLDKHINFCKHILDILE
jgi:hypothetical protein